MNKRKHISALTDEELVIQYKKTGDKDLIGELYNRYGHLVYGVCLKYLKQVNDAQDTLMLIFEKLITLLKKHEVSFLKSWLYQLTKNECFMLLRKKGKQQSQSIEENQWEDTSLDDIDEKQAEEQTLAVLEKAITQLKDKQKICIELFYLKKQSYQQVVDATGFSLKEVKSAIQNGKRNLKNIMEQKVR